jgi:hypothetical protein
MIKAAGLFSSLAMLCTAASAECNRPVKPMEFPDGYTATRDQMIDANRLVKQYTKDMSAYIECIDSGFLEYRVKKLANTRYAKDLEGAPATTQQAIVSRIACNDECEQMATQHMLANNKAVGEMQTVVKQFNEQLRAFKSRTAPP